MSTTGKSCAAQPLVVGELSGLPHAAFGPRSVVWWGNLGFMLIEGTAFVLAAGAYLYIRGRSHVWPPGGDQSPDLLWGTLFTGLLLLSAIPNAWLEHQTTLQHGRAVRLGLTLMTALAALLVIPRVFELHHLNVRWDHDAYGSLVWLLMVLHTTHLLTDFGDTAVQCVWLYTHEAGTNQYSDVHDNCAYWTFVVVSWLPIYALVYWAPRLT